MGVSMLITHLLPEEASAVRVELSTDLGPHQLCRCESLSIQQSQMNGDEQREGPRRACVEGGPSEMEMAKVAPL